MKKRLEIILLCFLGVFIFSGASKTVVVKKGSKVTMDYTLTVDGKVIDSSKEHGPFTYTQGNGEIIPGLEKGIAGMQVGEEKEIVVSPADAYGEINPQNFREVKRSTLPPNIKPKAGMMLQARTANGKVIPVKIAKVNKDTVVLDFNHPLAGKTLKFDVKILSIK